MSDDTTELLASETYERAFTKVMSGTEPGLLDDDERDVLRRARELTNTPAPGYPMPSRYDPTRSQA